MENTHQEYMPSYGLIADGDDEICLDLDGNSEGTRETGEPECSHSDPSSIPALALRSYVNVCPRRDDDLVALLTYQNPRSLPRGEISSPDVLASGRWPKTNESIG